MIKMYFYINFDYECELSFAFLIVSVNRLIVLQVSEISAHCLLFIVIFN